MGLYGILVGSVTGSLMLYTLSSSLPLAIYICVYAEDGLYGPVLTGVLEVGPDAISEFPDPEYALLVWAPTPLFLVLVGFEGWAVRVHDACTRISQVRCPYQRPDGWDCREECGL